MNLEFYPLTVAQAPMLAEFLRSRFQASLEVNSFSPLALHWKYFDSHPDWTGPRSFVVGQEGTIVAHAGVWPVRLLSPVGERKGIHLIDWAASPRLPGAGLFLLRKLAAMADVLLTVGGSSDTAQMLPKLGYRQVGTIKVFARVVRPWKQFRTSPNISWKTPLRLLRNSVWSLSHVASPPEGWKVVRVNQFDPALDSCLESKPWKGIRGGRSAALLNHMLNCPVVRFSGALLMRNGELQGYFVLSEVGGQARIADVWLATDRDQAWRPALALAAQTAAEKRSVCEIEMTSSSASTHNLKLEHGLGFHLRRSDPIYCYDPRGTLPQSAEWNLSLLDGDLSLLYNPLCPFLT